MNISSDELILALVGLVRETNPALLRQDADGFTVDFETLAAKKTLNADDLLLLKMRAALDAAPPSPAEGAEGAALTLALESAEAARLAETLKRLETLQPWPADVLAMSRALRARLAAIA